MAWMKEKTYYHVFSYITERVLVPIRGAILHSYIKKYIVSTVAKLLHYIKNKPQNGKEIRKS